MTQSGWAQGPLTEVNQKAHVLVQGHLGESVARLRGSADQRRRTSTAGDGVPQLIKSTKQAMDNIKYRFPSAASVACAGCGLRLLRRNRASSLGKLPAPQAPGGLRRR
jgi:hypothetical protein